MIFNNFTPTIMSKKITDFRTPFSLLNWVVSRNQHFSRYILYSVCEAEEKDIQNPSMKLEENEYPLFECYGNDTNGQYTYLLITTHFLTSIVDNISYKVDIEDIIFDLDIEDIIIGRKERTEYIESVKYDLQSPQGIIPIWIESGICENMIWGVFNQINFLKSKYGIKND